MSDTSNDRKIETAILRSTAPGVTWNVLASRRLSLDLLTQGLPVPRGRTMHVVLTRLGYTKLVKKVKWDGEAHSIWVRPQWSHASNDQIREALGRPISPRITSRADPVDLLARRVANLEVLIECLSRQIAQLKGQPQ